MATQETGIFDKMQEIRAYALANNRLLGVHKALFYQSGWFIYWAEGPPAAIDALLERVAKDPHHHSMRLLHRSAGPRHLLTPWSMMVGSSTESAAEFGSRVLEMRIRFQEGRQLPPTSVIRRLLAPLELGAPGTSKLDEPFHRIGVCSARGNESFELVRWLAVQNKGSYAARRVAGEDGVDNASDYVEFLHNGYPCRVIAVARQSLLHGLRRAFMPDWSNLLLLFCGDDKRDDALMDRVRAACVGLPAHPRLVGFAPTVATHRRMALAAAQEGLDYFDAAEAGPHGFPRIWAAFSPLLSSAGAPKITDWSEAKPEAPDQA